MRTSYQLDALMPRTRQMILATLLLNTERRWYLRDLAREISLPPSSLQRDLKALSEAGIIVRISDENRVFYQANAGLPFLTELQTIFSKTVGVVAILREALEPTSDNIDVAFIFGSFASESETTSSDIDLAIIADTSLLPLASGLRNAEHSLRREINVVHYSAGDLRSAWNAQKHFVRALIDGPKLFLIGDSHVLTAIVDSQAHQKSSDFAARAERVA